MIYNGKEIYTEDTFDFDIVKPCDFVNRKVVDNIADCMPPYHASGLYADGRDVFIQDG